MKGSKSDWDAQVRQVSAECVLYQTLNLIERLEVVSEPEYPVAAISIQEAFSALAKWIQQELWELAKRKELPREDEVRVRKLASLVQELNYRLRFLEVNNPLKTPPALQMIVDSWVKALVPEGCKVTALVRPQWRYNLEYRLITQELLDMIVPAELDPEMKLKATKPAKFLGALLGSDDHSYLSVLSFASLDTDDTLLVSLLGHEFGHLLEQINVDNEWETLFKATLGWLKHDQLDAELLNNGLEAPEEKAEELQKELNDSTNKYKREILADLVVTRMLGFGFFVAHAETLKTLARGDLDSVTSAGYPGTRLRLRLVLQELMDEEGLGFGQFLGTMVENGPGSHKLHPDAEKIAQYLGAWQREIEKPGDPDKNEKDRTPGKKGKTSRQDEREILEKLIKERTEKAIPLLVKRARKLIPPKLAASCRRESFLARIDALRREIPPLLDEDKLPTALSEILSAAWAFQLLTGNNWEQKKEQPSDRHTVYRRTCKLVLKAIELSGQDFQKIRSEEGEFKSFNEIHQRLSPLIQNSELPQGGVYNYQAIVKRLSDTCAEDKKITLVPAFPGCIQGASVDVHLGNWFKVFKRAAVESIPVSSKEDRASYLRMAQQVEYRPIGQQALVMHPGDLVLGCTLEFLALPLDTVATVDGKSQLGRLGLIVATATQVAPGFHGVVVLELVNAGMLPLSIKPGMQVAQLVFRGLCDPVLADLQYKGTSYCQMMP